MIEIIYVVGGGVVAALIANYVWEKQLRDRLSVTRVARQDSKEVPGMLELYSSQFPDEKANYSADDILSLLPDRHGHLKRKHTSCVDILLVARKGHDVVAFLFCHYYPAATHAIVSYCGRDPRSDAARTHNAIGKLLTRLVRELRSQDPKCTLILFEVTERSVRSAFRQRAIQLKYQAMELVIDYRRPRYCLEVETEGDALHLMCVALSGPATSGVITRDIAVSALESLHMLAYGDFYDPSDPRHHEYQQYLRRQVEGYRARLPDPVVVS